MSFIEMVTIQKGGYITMAKNKNEKEKPKQTTK